MKSGFEGWFFAAVIIGIFVLIPMAIVLSIVASKNLKERKDRLAVIELLDRL